MSKEKQSPIDHLTELRRRVFFSVLMFVLTFALSLWWVGPIYQYVTAQFRQPLLILGPNDILEIYFGLAGLSALTLSLPFVLYQIWAFVRPALRAEEARWVLLYLPAALLCFLLGLAFGYWILSPALLEVLLGWSRDSFEIQFTAKNYLSYLMNTTLPMAVLFELPVLVAFLTEIGLLTEKFLVKYRRYAYFILLAIAVVFTPADFISDLTMALPLIVLYEISIWLSWRIGKRKERRN